MTRTEGQWAVHWIKAEGGKVVVLCDNIQQVADVLSDVCQEYPADTAEVTRVLSFEHFAEDNYPMALIPIEHRGKFQNFYEKWLSMQSISIQCSDHEHQMRIRAVREFISRLALGLKY